MNADQPANANGDRPRRSIKWTREACIAALQEFHAEHGRIPTLPEMGQSWRTSGRLVPGLPCYRTLRDCFGSSADAMRAAGFEPRPTGGTLRTSEPDPLSPGTRLCSVEGCGRKHSARGFCTRHYSLLRRDVNRERLREKGRIFDRAKYRRLRDERAASREAES